MSSNLPEGEPRQFGIVFEAYVSFNGNDWFNDRPAILYQACVDLDSPEPEYQLIFTS